MKLISAFKLATRKLTF